MEDETITETHTEPANIPLIQELLTKPRKPTVEEALKSAPTAEEVLARPHAYTDWYERIRREALDG